MRKSLLGIFLCSIVLHGGMLASQLDMQAKVSHEENIIFFNKQKLMDAAALHEIDTQLLDAFIDDACGGASQDNDVAGERNNNNSPHQSNVSLSLDARAELLECETATLKVMKYFNITAAVANTFAVFLLLIILAS